MTLSMYEASIPTFIHGLNNLSAILKKAETYAEEKKFDSSILLGARLFPDMFPLPRQVQIACDIVKGAAARLAGADVPSFPDTESTFAELQSRIKKTIDFIKTVKPAQIDGSEKRPIKLTVGGNELSFDGQQYLLYFVIPNFYFHITTTYGILRHNGLNIGKADFLGKK